MRVHALPFALLIFLSSELAAQEVKVRVERRREAVIVDVEARMPGTIGDAWAVFTDYENMASFISNLTASNVLARTEHMLEVLPRGAPGSVS